jgi:hypothetical protein
MAKTQVQVGAARIYNKRPVLTRVDSKSRRRLIFHFAGSDRLYWRDGFGFSGEDGREFCLQFTQKMAGPGVIAGKDQKTRNE